VFPFLRLLIVLLFVGLTIQLIRLQVIQGEEYERRAAQNILRELPIPANRGLIYDRQGQLLVENAPRYAAAILPAALPETGVIATYQRLASLIDVTPEEIAREIEAHLEKEGPHTPVVIKEGIAEETALTLRELEPHVPGLELLIEPSRRYIVGELTSHILGYVGRISPEEYEAMQDEGYEFQDYIGKTGVELAYEDLQRGKPGRKLVEVDASGRELGVISERQPVDGVSLVLTIDVELQQTVLDVLRELAQDSESAAAVVIDVHSGEILAMGSLPGYDNNLFSQPLGQQQYQELLEAPGKPLVNHAIAEMYAPGSTFKTIVGAAALQEGVASTSTVITSRGYITVQNEYDPNVVYIFNDWAALGPMDFYRGLAMSSDVYFYYLAGGKADEGFRGLGEERVARYARDFGLGNETGIDLPGESAGVVPDAHWKEETKGEVWTIGDTYNFGIGQGDVAVTPLQMAVAVSAIANGGQVLRPHLLQEVRDSRDNVIKQQGREVVRRVPVDPAYLHIIAEAMRQSVTSGVANTAQVQGLEVAGKTGTAEFGPPRRDGSHATHGWFVGFAPFDDPQIAVAVFVQRGGGGQEAAPAAARILDYFFNGSVLAQSLAEGR
jgi:penicillin-binding protein 2